MSGKKFKQSSSIKHTLSEELPIIEEVNEFIDKERALLASQLLEKEQETKIWKQKYDNLIENIINSDSQSKKNLKTIELIADTVSNNVNSANENAIEQIGEVDDDIVELDGNAHIDKEYVLSSLQNNRAVLNLSNHDLHTNNNNVINIINKILTNKKSSEVKNLQMLLLSNCNLDDYCVSLQVLLGHSSLQAIDLSNNNISIPFQVTLFNVFKNFRKSPQYVLFHGNDSNCSRIKSTHDTPISSIIDSLTDSTWGISLTLPDFDMTMQKSAIRSATNDKGLYDSSTSIMLCRQFLQYMNKCLDPESQVSDKTNKTKSTSKKHSDILSSRRRGLQLLTVLGLQNAHLSKYTIQELQITLKLTISTLVELDLSHSYIGYQGAVMIGEALAVDNCNLIRLGLAGNIIGNKGFEAIGLSLKRNRTLTSLNCQSNSINDSGTHNFVKNVCNNKVFYRLNLIGNHDISQYVVHDINRYIYDNGCTFHVIWSTLDVKIDLTNSSQMSNHKRTIGVNNPMSMRVLYEIPNVVTNMLTPSKSVCLYKIDLKCIHVHYQSASLGIINDLKISWKWRPLWLMQGSSSNTKHNLAVHEHPCRSRFIYEYKIVTSKGASFYLFDEDFKTLNSSDNPLYDVSVNMDTFIEAYPWINCEFIIPLTKSKKDLPIQGHLELWLHSNNVDTNMYAANRFNAVESIHLKVSTHCKKSLDDIKSVDESGDLNYNEMSHLVYQTVEDNNLSEVMTDGYSPIQVYSRENVDGGDESSCFLITTDLKLRAKNNMSMYSSDQSTVDHKIIGYEWKLIVSKAYGSIFTLSSGDCFPTANTLLNPAFQSLYTEEKVEINEILDPWIWKPVTIEVGELSFGDIVILVARPAIKNEYGIHIDMHDYVESVVETCEVICRKSILGIKSHSHFDCIDDNVHVGNYTTSLVSGFKPYPSIAF